MGWGLPGAIVGSIVGDAIAGRRGLGSFGAELNAGLSAYGDNFGDLADSLGDLSDVDNSLGGNGAAGRFAQNNDVYGGGNGGDNIGSSVADLVGQQPGIGAGAETGAASGGGESGGAAFGQWTYPNYGGGGGSLYGPSPLSPLTPIAHQSTPQPLMGSSPAAPAGPAAPSPAVEINAYLGRIGVPYHARGAAMRATQDALAARHMAAGQTPPAQMGAAYGQWTYPNRAGAPMNNFLNWY